MDGEAQRQDAGLDPYIALACYVAIFAGGIQAHAQGQLAALGQLAHHLVAHVDGKVRALEIEAVAADGNAGWLRHCSGIT